jgi:hypothetical protein
MIDIKEMLTTQLATLGLPVFYELFVNSNTPIPCITYFEANNADHLIGDTVEYGEITINIKVWGYTVESLETNAALVEAKMRSLGFTKSASYHNFINGLGHYFIRFDAIGYKD